jgi:hypothetical protein
MRPFVPPALLCFGNTLPSAETFRYYRRDSFHSASHFTRAHSLAGRSTLGRRIRENGLQSAPVPSVRRLDVDEDRLQMIPGTRPLERRALAMPVSDSPDRSPAPPLQVIFINSLRVRFTADAQCMLFWLFLQTSPYSLSSSNLSGGISA